MMKRVVLLLLWKMMGADSSSSSSPMASSLRPKQELQEEEESRYHHEQLLKDIQQTARDIIDNKIHEEDDLVVPKTMNDVHQAMDDFSVENGRHAWAFLQGLAQSPTFIQQYWHQKPLLLRHCLVSVPPHTDQQDVLVFQTEGCKHWRVFPPPQRRPNINPLARGKSGDVLSFEEMDPPLIDVILRPGDVLYVPTGFPHTTDTIHNNDENDNNVDDDDGNKDDSSKISVHLTMGLDTHVWCLTMAHFRWTLLQRSEKEFQLQIQDDAAYWNSMEPIPIGFLASNSRQAWKSTMQTMRKQQKNPTKTDDNNLDVVNAEFKKELAEKVKALLIELEPSRWKRPDDDGDDHDKTELLPTNQEIDQVTEYYIQHHWKSLMENQDKLFSNVNPKDPEKSIVKAFHGTQEQNLIMENQDKLFSNVNPKDPEKSIVKAFHGTQEQNLIMENYGIFANNPALAQSFAQRRLVAQERTKGL